VVVLTAQKIGDGFVERILLVGATGFIGQALVQKLAGPERELVLLTRRPEDARLRGAWPRGVRLLGWDGRSPGPWLQELDGARALVNLAGHRIAAFRWTGAHRRRVRESRLRTTELLLEAMARVTRPPEVFLSASAVGYYGDRGEEQLTEASPSGTGFLAELARQWEDQAREAERLGVRVLLARIGVVLDRAGGLLRQLLPLYRLGLGGRLGSGRQWMAWIHRQDVARALAFLLERPDASGPWNVVSPHPVRQACFARELARLLRRPTWGHLPAWMLRWLLGSKQAQELLLASTRALPARLQAAGFRFRYPDLPSALRAAMGEAP
jgi:uncharacterized protein (TIGR01777 family)